MNDKLKTNMKYFNNLQHRNIALRSFGFQEQNIDQLLYFNGTKHTQADCIAILAHYAVLIEVFETNETKLIHPTYLEQMQDSKFNPFAETD